MGVESPRSDWDLFIEILAPSAGDKILDVGAGKGAKAARVLKASNGAEVYAIDPNEKRIEAAKRTFPNLKSSVASAESLPFPDSYFDKVYCTMALHHFADLDRALAEIMRVLKQGGTLIILEVEPHSTMGRLFRFLGRLAGEHMNIMSETQLLTKLGSTEGLKPVHSAGLGSSYLVQLART